MEEYGQIFKSKIVCPKLREGLIERKGLYERLDQSSYKKLSLVSAPPGYGKTTIVSAWCKTLNSPVVWLRLNKEEGSLSKFLCYLIASFQVSFPGSMRQTKSAMKSLDSYSLASLAQNILLDVEALGSDVYLVMDDYHEIATTSKVNELVGTVIDYALDDLHVVIVTRRDPSFPLRRMRATGAIEEIRISQLRFNNGETKVYLENSLDFSLAAKSLNNVQRVLEGWPNGLQMLSIIGQTKKIDNDYLACLSGGIGQAQECLFNEVINELDPAISKLLMYASIPSTFTVEQVDKIVAASREECLPSGHEFVNLAERCNLFVSRLELKEHYFRFHSLFRSLLIDRLHKRVDQKKIENIVVSVCEWYSKEGFVEEAIKLYLENGMEARGVELVGCYRRHYMDADKWLAIESWMNLFSRKTLQENPVLLLTRLSLEKFKLDVVSMEETIAQITSKGGEGHLTNGQLYELYLYKAIPKFWMGDVGGASVLLEKAVSCGIDDPFVLGEAYIYYTMVKTMGGDLKEALLDLEEVNRLNAYGHNFLATRILAAYSYVLYVSLDAIGSLRKADRLIVVATESVKSDHAKGWGWYMRMLCLFSSGRIESARRAADEVIAVGNNVEKRLQIEAFLVMGLCSLYLSDEEEINRSISCLRNILSEAPVESSTYELAYSSLARLYVQNNVLVAFDMAGEISQHPSAGTFVFWLEEPCLTRIKATLAMAGREAASSLLPGLTKLYDQVCSQHLNNYKVEILLLLSIAYALSENIYQAQTSLQKAVDEAVEQYWVAPFMEMARFIPLDVVESLKGEEQIGFISRVLNVTGESKLKESDSDAEENKLLAQLTSREVDILEHLVSRRRNKEIAESLFISTNTVSYHLKNIYQKLEVSSRREAVIRVEQLRLLKREG